MTSFVSRGLSQGTRGQIDGYGSAPAWPLVPYKVLFQPFPIGSQGELVVTVTDGSDHNLRNEG